MTAEEDPRCADCPEHGRIAEKIAELKHAVDGIARIVDTNTRKTNIMWDWRIIVGSVSGLIIAGLFWLIQDAKVEMRENTSAIQITIETAKVLATANRESSINRDQLLADRFLKLHERNNALIGNINQQNTRLVNEIIKVMNVISLNQKRVMSEIELDYMEPDYVRPTDMNLRDEE